MKLATFLFLLRLRLRLASLRSARLRCSGRASPSLCAVCLVVQFRRCLYRARFASPPCALRFAPLLGFNNNTYIVYLTLRLFLAFWLFVRAKAKNNRARYCPCASALYGAKKCAPWAPLSLPKSWSVCLAPFWLLASLAPVSHPKRYSGLSPTRFILG